MIFFDTDILIDYFRNFPPCLDWLEKQEDTILISGFTCLELYAGCANRLEIQKLEKAFQKNIWVNNQSTIQELE